MIGLIVVAVIPVLPNVFCFKDQQKQWELFGCAYSFTGCVIKIWMISAFLFQSNTIAQILRQPPTIKPAGCSRGHILTYSECVEPGCYVVRWLLVLLYGSGVVGGPPRFAQCFGGESAEGSTTLKLVQVRDAPRVGRLWQLLRFWENCGRFDIWNNVLINMA